MGARLPAVSALNGVFRVLRYDWARACGEACVRAWLYFLGATLMLSEVVSLRERGPCHSDLAVNSYHERESVG